MGARASAMATYGERIQALRNLHRESFLSKQLRDFLVTEEYLEVANAVNLDVALDQCSLDVVEELARRGLIDRKFFDRLTKVRAGREEEIKQVEKLWLNESHESARSPGSATRPCNLPLASIDKLFKGRDDFLAE